MSMSANFHNVTKVELDTLFIASIARSHPTLTLLDADGSYVCAHLTPGNVDQLEDALASYRQAYPRVEQKEAVAEPLLGALETACALIEDAEKDTDWVSGDPYGDSATVAFRKLIARATGKDA